MARTLVGGEEADDVIAHRHVVVELRNGAIFHIALVIHRDTQRLNHRHSLLVALRGLVDKQLVVASGNVATGGTRVDVLVLHPSLVIFRTELHTIALLQVREHRLDADALRQPFVDACQCALCYLTHLFYIVCYVGKFTKSSKNDWDKPRCPSPWRNNMSHPFFRLSLPLHRILIKTG